MEEWKMTHLKKILLLTLLVSTFSFAGGKVLYTLDFTTQKDGDAKGWLHSKGFKFLLDAEELSMKFSGGKLVIQASGQKAAIFGIKFPSGKYLNNIGSAKIEWGVDKFPQGANWAGGNNRLAIGVFFLLGTEKFSSGLPFGVNAAPYFLCPFIGQKEKVGQRYMGELYKEGGRYYCVANKKNSTVVSHFNIDQKFQQAFKKNTPPLTAFAFQLNTKDTTGGSKAFIKRITFYSK